ncbi:unnamed protein product [Debaryomyces fabryi]|nr:unnamed protein product [Debaryomyces fabryi]
MIETTSPYKQVLRTNFTHANALAYAYDLRKKDLRLPKTANENKNVRESINTCFNTVHSA